MVKLNKKFNLVHKFYPYTVSNKIPDAKATVEKEWKKFVTIEACKLDKSKSKKEVILEEHRVKCKVHITTLMDLSHLANAKLEHNFPKFFGTLETMQLSPEQDSSASQMTAAKLWNLSGAYQTVMDK